ELVGLAPDVILASASAAVGALQQTTRSVPAFLQAPPNRLRHQSNQSPAWLMSASGTKRTCRALPANVRFRGVTGHDVSGRLMSAFDPKRTWGPPIQNNSGRSQGRAGLSAAG